MTIVMYHYVRELHRSRYPAIKGLDVEAFRQQLAYFRRHYEVIRAEEMIEAYRRVGLGEPWPLPPNALLLTFDDGYLDHYRYVCPILDEMGFQGSFFPPAQAITERVPLLVNKIHFLLASVDPAKLVPEILAEVEPLEPPQQFYNRIAVANRFDPAEVIFIKRALQVELPEALRDRITSRLFREYVTADEAAFAEELYLSVDQVRSMVRHGMFVGSHSYSHPWLGRLSPEEQAREVDLSLTFLQTVGAPLEGWIMCYPYGSSNESLWDLLRQKGASLGLTTEVAMATPQSSPLQLPRLDTNDLPKLAAAQPNDWTVAALH
jgi:peptidoglycan/xylan/chitin deacetylase (PgdA/CDA1 family)